MVFITSMINAQEKCFKIDSIRIMYLDFDLGTSLDVDRSSIKLHSNDFYFHEVLITDSSLIDQFCRINFDAETLNNIKSLDYRMEVEVFGFNQKLFSLGLNNSYLYEINGVFYFYNLEFIKWLRKVNIKPKGDILFSRD